MRGSRPASATIRTHLHVGSYNRCVPAGKLEAGSRLARYDVVDRLGAGGMGEVYLCEDPTLGRRVAIKVLSAAADSDDRATARFLREARAAARLTHPNVCTVYEVGEDSGTVYIAMQYVEGETLASRLRQGPLSGSEVLRVGLGVAGALAEAHRLGIVHRDIKPQNIMVTTRGDVVVLDFGLAKLIVSDGSDESDLTRTNTIAGTVPYMSPEQLRGEHLDGRTDIFSLGVVLYELLTGTRPFGGAGAAEVITSILTRDPAPLPGSAGELGAVIHRCIQRDPELRFSNADEMLAHLSVAGGSTSPIIPVNQEFVATRIGMAAVDGPAPRQSTRARSRKKSPDSLAILPFQVASATPEAEFLGEGIFESLIADLSTLPRLRVMARSTVSRFHGRDIDPIDVGRQLDVAAVLSGRVQSLGDRFVVRAELVNVSDGSSIWSDQYVRANTDVLKLQDELVQEISSKLRPRLSPAQKSKVTKKRTSDPVAYELYLRGLHLLNRRDIISMKNATELFHEAINADPVFAAPYCGLAEAFIYFGFLEMRAPLEVYPSARAAATKALELDPEFAEAHAALGWMKVTHEWDWAGADREFRAAVRSNPNCAVAHHWHGLMLSYTRRFDAAREKLLHARALDPLAPIINTAIGSTSHHQGEFEEAIRIYRGVADLAPGFVPLHLYLGQALEAAGRFEEALAQFVSGLERSRDETLLLAALGHCYGAMGRRDEAVQIKDTLEARRNERYTSPYGIALVHAGLRNEAEALLWLETAYEERAAWLTTVQVDARWNGWREHPRFRAVVEQMRFPRV